MNDTSQKTCPGDRFNQILQDPAARAAIHLQAAVWYRGCSGRLGRSPQPQLLPHSTPSFLLSSQAKNVRMAPDELSRTALIQPLSKLKNVRRAPDELTQAAPSQPSGQSKNVRMTPDKPPYSAASQPSAQSKNLTPCQLYPSKTKISSQPRHLTREVHMNRMNNSREISRPWRAKKPIFRLQVGSKKEQTKVYSETQFQTHQKGNPSKLSVEQSQVSNNLLKISVEEQESVCPTKLKRENLEPNLVDENNAVNHSREIPFNENVVPIDHQTMVVNESNQRDIGNETLEDDISDKNNNVPPVTTTSVESDKENKNYKYISRWVPFLRKRKLCVEGDLLKLDEEPNSKCARRYFTSKILERDSARRVAGKQSLYALEGPLLIPDPSSQPMPLFVIEKFKDGIPKDWKDVVDIWASFSDHRVIQSSVSQFDLDRFSLCSSEIGSKIVNICAMTDGSLIANMAAVNDGNILMKQVSSQCLSPDI